MRAALVLALLLALAVALPVAAQTTPTPTYTPVPTRTPYGGPPTSTPAWGVDATVAVSVNGTPEPIGVFQYTATAGDLLVALLVTAVLLFLCVVMVVLYRERA